MRKEEVDELRAITELLNVLIPYFNIPLLGKDSQKSLQMLFDTSINKANHLVSK